MWLHCKSTLGHNNSRCPRWKSIHALFAVVSLIIICGWVFIITGFILAGVFIHKHDLSIWTISLEMTRIYARMTSNLFVASCRHIRTRTSGRCSWLLGHRTIGGLLGNEGEERLESLGFSKGTDGV